MSLPKSQPGPGCHKKSFVFNKLQMGLEKFGATAFTR